jgi:fructose transport system ATP-binding protein
MTATVSHPQDTQLRAPVLSARGLVKTFGRVIGLDGVDLDLYAGEVRWSRTPVSSCWRSSR